MLFEPEVEQIRPIILVDLVIAIEHFGFTAKPEIVVKPIINLLIEVSSLKKAKQTAIELLEWLGSAFWQDNPNPLRTFFVKGLLSNSPRTHYAHMVESDSVLWKRLIFKDYLPTTASKRGLDLRTVKAQSSSEVQTRSPSIHSC